MIPLRRSLQGKERTQPTQKSAPRKLSPKREAERLKAEGRPAWSTIAPKPPKKKDAKPRKAVRRKNSARQKREFERAYGGEARVTWIQSQPSVVSGERPCVNAHVRTGGIGRKADACWIVPLTDQEHKNYHVVGKRFFEKWACVDLDDLAAKTEAAWQQHLTASSPIT